MRPTAPRTPTKVPEVKRSDAHAGAAWTRKPRFRSLPAVAISSATVWCASAASHKRDWLESYSKTLNAFVTCRKRKNAGTHTKPFFRSLDPFLL